MGGKAASLAILDTLLGLKSARIAQADIDTC